MIGYLRLGFLFRNPHGGVFRERKGAAGDNVIVHLASQTQGVLCGADAFGKGHVRQQPAADDVARGINAGDVGHHMSVHQDASFFHLDAQFFKAQTIGIEAPPGGQEDGIRGKVGPVVQAGW